MQFKSIGGATPPDCCKEINMKLGDIKIESLKIMFVSTHTDLSIGQLNNALNDENYSSYLVNMPGAINRCFSTLEEKRVLPIKAYTLKASEGLASAKYIRFDLASLIEDFCDIDRLVCERGEEYEGNAEFRMEGNILVLPIFDDEVYTVLYYPSIPRITSETDNETELPIPDKIAAHIPYFVKGDLFRDDEPDEANEARNWFEAAMEQIIATKQSYSDKVFDKYSQTEI